MHYKGFSEFSAEQNIDVYKILTTVSFGAAQLILGLTDAAMAELAILLSDMPDDIANQVSNSFANDDCSNKAKDRTTWKSPGAGLAVSPDDIINGWTYSTRPVPEQLHKLNPPLNNILLGVYGSNSKVKRVAPQRLQDVPRFMWDISLGDSLITGTVRFSDKDPFRGGQGVTRARVYVGCTVVTSIGQGGLRATVPSGKYFVRAVFDDPETGLVWQSKPIINDFPLNGNGQVDLELDPPAATNRDIIIYTHWDITNHKVFKNWTFSYDDNPHSHFLGEGLMIESPTSASAEFPGHPIDDWGDAQLKYELTLDRALNVKVTCHARMESHADDEWVDFEFLVPAKKDNREPFFEFWINLTRDAGLYPIKGHLHIYVHNNTMEGGLPA